MKPIFLARDVNASCSLKSALRDFAKPARSLFTSDRNACGRKLLGHNLQGYSFPDPRCPRNQTMSICIFQFE